MEPRLATLAKRFDVIAGGIKELESALAAAAAAAPSSSTNIGKQQQQHQQQQGKGKGKGAAAHVDPATLPALQPHAADTPAVAALRRHCLAAGLHSAAFTWVPSDYYQQNLQWRRDILGAATIQHLCKTIVLENTHCTNEDCAARENSRYYMIVYRYVDRFVSEDVMRVIRDLNAGLGKKKFNFRLADPAKSLELTGFGHGAVCPFGTATKIPVVLSHEMLGLAPSYFWMGGGHEDCKVRVDVEEFIAVVNPIVAAITTPLTAEELERIAD